MNLTEKKLNLSSTAKYKHAAIGQAHKDNTCIFPVKVYDSKGVLKKTISVQELNARKTLKKGRYYAAKTYTRKNTSRSS